MNVFSQARSLLDEQSPFCIVKLPGKENLILFSRYQSTKPTEGPYIILQDWRGIEKTYCSLETNGQNPKALNIYKYPKSTTFEDYSIQFKKYQSAFANSGIRKAILSRILNVKRPTSFNPIEAFAKLCETRKDTFNHLLLHPTMGLWMGASPEILLKKTGHKAQTVSLAGTQPKSQENYKWNDKEVEEQELVSEHIRSVLQKTDLSNFKENGPITAEAGNIVHLKTIFDFDFKSHLKSLALADELHPTPAISGLPVSESTKLINHTETHERLLYTGYLGLINSSDLDIYVNLRCMQIHEDEVSIYVGGGITDKSVLENEWQETEVKAKTMKSILNEF